MSKVQNRCVYVVETYDMGDEKMSIIGSSPVFDTWVKAETCKRQLLRKYCAEGADYLEVRIVTRMERDH